MILAYAGFPIPGNTLIENMSAYDSRKPNTSHVVTIMPSLTEAYLSVSLTSTTIRAQIVEDEFLDKYIIHGHSLPTQKYK